MRPASLIGREVDGVIVRVCVQQSQRRLTDGTNERRFEETCRRPREEKGRFWRQ